MTHDTTTVLGGEPEALHSDAVLDTGHGSMKVDRSSAQAAHDGGLGASLAELECELSQSFPCGEGDALRVAGNTLAASTPPSRTHSFVYGSFGLPTWLGERAEPGGLASAMLPASLWCMPRDRC